MTLLEVKNLNKYYHKNENNELHVLKDLNFKITNTSMTAIIGKSGCGKTTLLNIIGCLDDYDSGDVVFNGQNLNELSDAAKSRIRASDIGFVLQEFALIEEETALSNVVTPLYFNSNVKLKNFKNLGNEMLNKWLN